MIVVFHSLLATARQAHTSGNQTQVSLPLSVVKKGNHLKTTSTSWGVSITKVNERGV
jgi:hypothetical protein